MVIIRIFNCRRARLSPRIKVAYMGVPARGIFRLIKVIAILLLCGSSAVFAETVQEHVHHMSPNVMPFDMSKTIHIFKMTESGGVQWVIAKDAGDTAQIALIQRHLKHEAEKFQRGDYSDPTMLHGSDMPGLKEIESGAALIKVSYATLSAGAEIIFKTNDIHLLTAIHRWFGAQLSEHGVDAKAE